MMNFSIFIFLFEDQKSNFLDINNQYNRLDWGYLGFMFETKILYVFVGAHFHFKN